jgi:SAM-dependent methyltransferase
VAQLGARFHGMEEVAGSIPARSTNSLVPSRWVMPALHRTIIPRIRIAVAKYGALGALQRSFRAPFHLFDEYRTASKLYRGVREPDPFDVAHNVETSQRVHVSDLAIDCSNWVYGGSYMPASAELVMKILPSLPIRHEDFVFIDLGSGKGRVLLMASDYPFKQIIGVEYAASLHQVAVENIQRYRSEGQKCHRLESRCGDIADFSFPEMPMVVFLFNPARGPVMQSVAQNLLASLARLRRETWLLYVNPIHKEVFERGPLHEVRAKEKYVIYSNC